MRELLRHRDARLLLGGQAVSTFGDWLLLLVFGIWVKDLTGSNGAAGSVILAMTLPALAAPLVGLVADRVPRRRLLVVNDLLAALALTPLLLVHDRSRVWLVFVVAALYGLSQVVLGAGVTALVQEMLEDDLLAAANGVLASVRQGMRLVGPLIGAGVYALSGPATLVAIDAATFVLSALAFAAIRAGGRVPQRAPDDGARGEQDDAGNGGFLAELGGGWRFVRADAVLRPMFVSGVLAFSLVGVLEPAVFGIVEAFGRPASFVGVVASVQGVGAVAGGLAAAALIGRRGSAVAFRLALLGLGATLVVVATPWLGAVLAAACVAGLLLPLLEIALTTTLQERTPPWVIGRVAALSNVAFSVPQMLSIALGAALVDRVGYVALVLAASAGLLVGGLYALVRLPGRSATPAPEPAQTA